MPQAAGSDARVAPPALNETLILPPDNRRSDQPVSFLSAAEAAVLQANGKFVPEVESRTGVSARLSRQKEFKRA